MIFSLLASVMITQSSKTYINIRNSITLSQCTFPIGTNYGKNEEKLWSREVPFLSVEEA